VDLAAALEPHRGLHAKAMWAYLHYPDVFELASLFHYVEGLAGRFWVRVTQLPRQAADTSAEAVRALGRALSDFYQREQGRGHRCTVETYLRGERYHYYFAYPDDYADVYVGHGDDGHLVRRPQKRAFEVVFVYDPADGALDLYARGDRRLKYELRRLFCAAILHDERLTGWCDQPVYELVRLRRRGFPLPTDPADGIEAVRIKLLRLTVAGGRRIVLEPSPAGGPEDVYDLMDECLSDKCLHDPATSVTQVEFQFTLAPRGDVRPKKMEFRVTLPDGCTLKSLPEDQRALGEKYLRLWGVDRG
jgi:hypothetical protein